MVRRPQVLDDDGGRGAALRHRRPARPNLTGDLETLYEPCPAFRTALRGYDRLQVDNYVAWVEEELRAARRECDDLISRHVAVTAELQVAQRLLTCSPEGRELLRTSEQVGELLRVAADEAAGLTAAGAAEADRLRAEARREADLLLRRAHEVEQEARAGSDRLAAEARQARDAAGAEVERARTEAGELLSRAADEAAATCRTARLELQELHRRQARARQTLAQVTRQVDGALGALAGPPVEARGERPAGRAPLAS